MLTDVLRESESVFWVAGSQGVARLTAPLCQTPSAASDLEKTVYAITEDREGSVWFAYDDLLVRLQGLSSKRFLLPKDILLPGGRTGGVSSPRRMARSSSCGAMAAS